MSAMYQLWAAARLKDVMAWQETWASQVQHGARKQHGTEDVFWALDLRVDQAVLNLEP